MAKPVKYLARGAQVTAVEVTEDNAAELAAEHGLALFTSPRTGQPYVLLEAEGGTQRADAGGFLVLRGDEPAEALSAEVFHERYERP